MKKLYFFGFFVVNFILSFSSNNGTSIDVSTKLNLISPTTIAIQKTSDVDEIRFNLDNSKEEEVKVYIKENVENIKLFNNKDISGNLALNSKKNNLKNKVTVRVLYN